VPITTRSPARAPWPFVNTTRAWDRSASRCQVALPPVARPSGCVAVAADIPLSQRCVVVTLDVRTEFASGGGAGGGTHPANVHQARQTRLVSLLNISFRAKNHCDHEASRITNAAFA
jgi:hypothetical protein